jgi:hypothetical protein
MRGVDDEAIAQAPRDVQAGMPIEHAASTHNLTPATLEKRHTSHEPGTATTYKRPKIEGPEAASEDEDWDSEVDEVAIAKFAAEFCVGELKPNHPSDIYRHLGWDDEASFAPRPLRPELASTQHRHRIECHADQGHALPGQALRLRARGSSDVG